MKVLNPSYRTDKSNSLEMPSPFVSNGVYTEVFYTFLETIFISGLKIFQRLRRCWFSFAHKTKDIRLKKKVDFKKIVEYYQNDNMNFLKQADVSNLFSNSLHIAKILKAKLSN